MIASRVHRKSFRGCPARDGQMRDNHARSGPCAVFARRHRSPAARVARRKVPAGQNTAYKLGPESLYVVIRRVLRREIRIPCHEHVFHEAEVRPCRIPCNARTRWCATRTGRATWNAVPIQRELERHGCGEARCGGRCGRNPQRLTIAGWRAGPASGRVRVQAREPAPAVPMPITLP